ncbi:MAG TPA: asparagine synthase-related protein, partial [Anaerolineaceae bacterium]|nr:asparagine synthase-related protein [Anaerolineaceae bacterium]
MPGIAGLVTTDPTPSRSEIERMIRPLQRLASHRADRYAADCAALAAISPDGERALSHRGGVWLGLAGAVVEETELYARLRRHDGFVGPVETQADLLLELYLAYGLPGVINLNGSYALAVWEEQDDRLTLVRDRLGTANLYTWSRPGRLMFASEYKAITWHPDFNKRIDEVALTDFFTYHQVMLDRTFFTDVRMLPPGGALIVQAGRVTLHSHWDLTFGPRDQPALTPDGWVDAFAERLAVAVKRRMQPHACLFLTGGLDSRSIAGMAQKVAPEQPLQTATVGSQAGTDAQVARGIAAALGYPHALVELSGDYLARYAAQCAWRAEGKLNAFGSWIYAGEDYLHARGLRAAMTGVFGNPVSGRHFPDILAFVRSEGQMRWAMEAAFSSRKRALARVFKPALVAGAGDQSMRVFVDALVQSGAPTIYGKYDEMYFRVAVPRLAHNADVLGDQARVFDPFTDRDLVDFAIHMPPAVRAGGNFFKRMIVRHLPEAAAVVHGRTGRLLADDLRSDRFRLTQYA